MKIWTDLSSVLSQFTRVTDGQTDRQTDRILIAIPRLHYMQRGKNVLATLKNLPNQKVTVKKTSINMCKNLERDLNHIFSQ